jgi:hypothetical protein
MKAKKEYEWCMLWQQEKVTIEQVLKDAFAHYIRKVGHKPEKVYVNPKVELKIYDGVILVPDKQMYSLGIVGLCNLKENVNSFKRKTLWKIDKR